MHTCLSVGIFNLFASQQTAPTEQRLFNPSLQPSISAPCLVSPHPATASLSQILCPAKHFKSQPPAVASAPNRCPSCRTLTPAKSTYSTTLCQNLCPAPAYVQYHHAISLPSIVKVPLGAGFACRMAKTDLAPCSADLVAASPPISVLHQPGHTAFTVMPLPRRFLSAAYICVARLSSSLETEYGAQNLLPVTPSSTNPALMMSSRE